MERYNNTTELIRKKILLSMSVLKTDKKGNSQENFYFKSKKSWGEDV